MWAQDAMEGYGRGGVRSLGTLGCLGDKGLPPNQRLFSPVKLQQRTAKTLLSFNRAKTEQKPGPGRGKGEARQGAWGGLSGGALLSALPRVSLQRRAQSRAWWPGGPSSSSAPSSPSTRAATPACPRAWGPAHARISWCWCEVGLPRGSLVPAAEVSLPPAPLPQPPSLPGAVAPRISSAGDPSEHSVLEGGWVSLECRAEGQPTPQISWLKDGQPLELQRPSHAR